MEWMLLPLKRYARFSGRSRRREFWMFALFATILLVVALFLDNLFGFGTSSHYAKVGGYRAEAGFSANGGVLAGAVMLALLPSLAVEVRRLHDTDRSGWWILLGFIPLAGPIVLPVFFCLDGTRGSNRFGADPKEDAPAEPA